MKRLKEVGRRKVKEETLFGERCQQRQRLGMTGDGSTQTSQTGAFGNDMMIGIAIDCRVSPFAKVMSLLRKVHQTRCKMDNFHA